MSDPNHPFERELSVSCEMLEGLLLCPPPVPWFEFWLNPRRLRGSDFLMRWSQGVWSEHRLMEAVNAAGGFFAIPYGPSGTAPTGSVREFELYFERLEHAGLGKLKRPDLLIFAEGDRGIVEKTTAEVGGVEELPFTVEDDPRIRRLLKRAVIAVECENSRWRTQRIAGLN